MNKYKSPLPPRKWLKIIKKYGYICSKCHMPDKMTQDHIVPRYHGGNNSELNVQPLCRKCNKNKGCNTENTESDLLKRVIVEYLF